MAWGLFLVESQLSVVSSSDPEARRDARRTKRLIGSAVTYLGAEETRSQLPVVSCRQGGEPDCWKPFANLWSVAGRGGWRLATNYKTQRLAGLLEHRSSISILTSL
jgi:hypothetical protein